MRSYRFIVLALIAAVLAFFVSGVWFSNTELNEKNQKLIEALKNKTAELMAELSDKKSELEKQNKVIQKLRVTNEKLQTEIQQLKSHKNNPVANSNSENSPTPAPSTGLHPKAKCRITAFTYNPGDPSVRLSVQFPDGSIRELAAPFRTAGQDEFFIITQLPPGTQVVVPEDNNGVWTVKVDSRKGYAAKITNPDNVEHSQLDYESNAEDFGGKRFESGEVFIILRQSGMTIYPPYYTRPDRQD